MKHSCPLFVACLLICCLVARADKADDYIKIQMEKQHIPGLSLAVVRDGKVVKAKGYGFANLEWDEPVTPGTLFQSGSIGKQFTATAVMMLVEEGKIELNDPMSQYLPGTPDAWKGITIRHLLTHTSGIGDSYSALDLRQDYTEDELVKKAASVPAAFAPGERWEYSNIGYVLLGIIIHKVTGKFYGDFLKERIFTPLGMSKARNISEEDIVPHRAAGYRLVKGVLKNQEWVSPTLNTTADGSLYLTSLDMAKWDAALYTEKLLKRSSLEQMWTPVKLNNGTTAPYGFGWTLEDAKGHRIIEHGGSWQGFKSYIARYVEDKLTVIVFINTANSNPSLLAHTVAGIYVPAVMPPTYRPIEDKEPKITAQIKTVLEQLAAGKPDRDQFTPDLAALLSARLRQGLADRLVSLGPLQSTVLVERKNEGDNRLYRYRATYREATRLVLCTFDKDARITGFSLQSE
jgi:CubicO group peptidase (beta-lactamase class C family)